jgi:hypothetical protein
MRTGVTSGEKRAWNRLVLKWFDSETPEMSDSRMVDRSGLMKRGERGGWMLGFELKLRLECKEGEWDMSECMSKTRMTTRTRIRKR